MSNGNIMDNHAVFDAIAEHEQSRLSTPVKTPEKNFVINTTDGKLKAKYQRNKQ